MSQTQALKWLNSFRKTAGTALALSIGLNLCAGVLLIVQAGALAWSVHQVVFEGLGLSRVMPALWLILALVLARSILVWFGSSLAGQAAARTKEIIRLQLLEHLSRANPAGLTSYSTGQLVHLSTDGVEEVDGYFSGYLPQMALAAMLPPAILVFILPLDWISGLILLFTAPFIPFFMIIIGRRAEKLNQEQWHKITRLTHRFLDAIQGLTTLKMFNAGKREARVVSEISREYGKSTLSVLRIAFLSALVLEFMATVSIAVVAVIIGFRLLWGEMDFMAGFFILILAPEFYLPLRNLGSKFHSRMSAIAAAENMLKLTRLPLRRDNAGKTAPDFSRTRIRFENVSFSYGEAEKAVHNLDFITPAPGLTCLTGPSGSGKTTVLRLILGLVDAQQGQVWVNDSDFTHLDNEAWLRHVAYLPQRPHLLGLSIMENIRLGNDKASREEVYTAARKAGIHREIMAMPQGYATILGEDGQDLSGGQRQRVALARAFVRPCPLVLADEPGAGLDRKNREMVHFALLELARERTVIICTHDQDVLPGADLVVQLKDTLSGPDKVRRT